MSYPIKYPTPQGANVQIFSQGGTTSDWVKPQGASFVWFTLIGAGGGGFKTGTVANQAGGGSGAVTNFMCPAFLIPDVLRITVGVGGLSSTTPTAGGDTTVIYQQKDGTGYTLLTGAGGGAASAANQGAGGGVSSANFFTAMGFYQSIQGQFGATGAISASATTFLSGGAAQNGDVTANYGYTVANGRSGFFMLQPIIVGAGAGAGTGFGGIGCGGGGGSTSAGGAGGNGLVVIITW